MFFTGTLQEGISTALQQSKLVVCFVTDNQEESTTWETDYLADTAIASSLEKEAVVLRLEAGSEEAGYLAAIFPLPKTPTVVIIKNGQLKEYLSAGTAKEEFVTRVASAFSAQPEARTQGESGVTPAVQTTEGSAPASSSSARSAPSTSGQATPAPSSVEPPTEEGEGRRQAALKERERIEKEKAERRKEKGKMPEQDADHESPGNVKQNEDVKKASKQLAERQRQAREEKARVLKLIADDRAERKAREEQRRQEREAERRAAAGEETVSPIPGAAAGVATPSLSSVKKKTDQCAIQVRLFDGSMIRTRVPAKATLAGDVRKWIEENRTDGKDPYTFKVILTPLPNRAIDHATEEDKTLEELGLTPSSTLVLTPVDRYSTAYTNMNAGLTNPVSRLITAVLAFVVSILGGIAGALGGLGSGGGEDSTSRPADVSQQDQNPSQGQATGRDGSGRIKGFQNPDDRRKDYQLYNGNSVSLLRSVLIPQQDDANRS